MGQKKKSVTDLPSRTATAIPPTASYSQSAPNANPPKPNPAGYAQRTPPSVVIAESEDSESPDSQNDNLVYRKRVLPLSTDEKHEIQQDPVIVQALTLFEGDVIDMRRDDPEETRPASCPSTDSSSADPDDLLQDDDDGEMDDN